MSPYIDFFEGMTESDLQRCFEEVELREKIMNLYWTVKAVEDLTFFQSPVPQYRYNEINRALNALFNFVGLEELNL